MNNPKKKHPVRKIARWIFGSIFILLAVVAIFLYINFNRLLSEALMKSFNSSLISDVYELKFDKLNVNFLSGNIVVKDVEIHPREKPLKEYPYINSSFELKTRKIQLVNVEIRTLLRESRLKLERVQIADPALEFLISDAIPIFIPFEQANTDTIADQEKTKKTIKGFFLKEFELENASFHVINTAKQRDLSVKNLNISFSEMLLDQNPGQDIFSYSRINLSVGEISGSLKNEALKYISLKDFSFTVDQLKIQKSVDTLIHHFDDFTLGLGSLDLQTSDSIFHVTLEAFNLSYKNKSISTKNISFKPNISNDELQKRYKFQNTQFSGSVGSLEITGINFDSFINNRTLLIDNISLDSVVAFVYKDKTKPMDMEKFPIYFGQTFSKISMPLLVKEITAKNVELINNERKPDGSSAQAKLTRASLYAGNITNLSVDQPFVMKADAYLEDKAHFKAELGFDYQKPQFSIDVNFDKFNLPDLNSVIQAYTPASIESGTVDKLSFSGTAYETHASGTMTFLFQDLIVDLHLKEQAKWKNSVLAFAANEATISSNPSGPTLPPRIVQFNIDRDMNKGFINVVIKSALNGLKETIIMSKDNKKTFKETKKQTRKEARKEKKK
jgi:hypothetical protein